MLKQKQRRMDWKKHGSLFLVAPIGISRICVPWNAHLRSLNFAEAPMKIMGPSGPTAKPEATDRQTPNHLTKPCLAWHGASHCNDMTMSHAVFEISQGWIITCSNGRVTFVIFYYMNILCKFNIFYINILYRYHIIFITLHYIIYIYTNIP